jgi:hypothetical protein
VTGVRGPVLGGVGFGTLGIDSDGGLKGLEGACAVGVALRGPVARLLGETDCRRGTRDTKLSFVFVVSGAGDPSELKSSNDIVVEGRCFGFDFALESRLVACSAENDTPEGETGGKRDVIGEGVLVSFIPIGLLASAGGSLDLAPPPRFSYRSTILEIDPRRGDARGRGASRALTFEGASLEGFDGNTNMDWGRGLLVRLTGGSFAGGSGDARDAGRELRSCNSTGWAGDPIEDVCSSSEPDPVLRLANSALDSGTIEAGDSNVEA